jgi:hypothetical protein
MRRCSWVSPPGRSRTHSILVCTSAVLVVFGVVTAYAAPPAKDVTVGNTEANPVIVRDGDNSARHFFQTGTFALTNAFAPSGFGLTLTTVPAGLVLVIEYVSAACQGSSGTQPSTFRLTTTVGHFFLLAPTSSPLEGVASQITRIYAGPLTDVNLTVFPTTIAPTVTCNVAISGHLVSE